MRPRAVRSEGGEGSKAKGEGKGGKGSKGGKGGKGKGGKGKGCKGKGGKGEGNEGGKGGKNAESIILSAPPAKSMMLSAPFDCVITHAMLTNMLIVARRAATKKQQSAMLTIAKLQLLSQVPQWQCQLVCHQR